MKVRLRRDGEGTYEAMVQKTRRDENPSRLVRGIKRADLQKAIADAVKEVAPTVTTAPVISS